MLHSVILVLREVLEAALIISLLLALSRHLRLPLLWSAWAMAGGLLGALGLCLSYGAITQLADGMGQEWLNALLLLGVVLAGNGLCYALIVRVPRIEGWRLLLVGPILLSIAREATEVLLYFSSFSAHEQLYPVLLGGVIGLGIGLSLGCMCYYALVLLRWSRFRGVCLLLLLLVVGGQAVQMAKELMQSGLLSASLPVWNSSGLIAESSILGELLTALLGYEATPTREQLLFYGLAVLPILGMLLKKRCTCSFERLLER